MRPQNNVGFGDKRKKNSRIRTATFHIPGEAKILSTPIAPKRPEKRELVVDSRALLHMMSKKRIKLRRDGHSKKKSRTPTIVVTANGEVHIHEEAQVFVHDLNQFVTVQLLEETAVLSLGKLCEDHGYSCEWVSGH